MAKKTPSFIDKVNFILDSFVEPCTGDPIVWARLALPAAGEVLMTLVEFDQYDVLRAMFKPKPVPGGRSYRHSRRGRKGGKAGSSLLSIGENIGASLRGSTILPTASDSRKLDFLWKLDGYGQRALFYWMIADVTVEGLYTWASLVERSPACSEERGGALRYHTDEQGLLGLLGWMTPLMGVPQPDPQPPGWSGAPGVFRCDYAAYEAAWWCTLFNSSQQPVGVQLGWWHENTVSLEPDIQGEVRFVPPLGNVGYLVKGSFSAGRAAIFAGRTLGGNIKMLNPECVAWTRGLP